MGQIHLHLLLFIIIFRGEVIEVKMDEGLRVCHKLEDFKKVALKQILENKETFIKEFMDKMITCPKLVLELLKN